MAAHGGLAFVQTLLIAGAVLAGVAGGVFLLLEIGRSPRRQPADGRLADWWSGLAGTRWPAVPRWASTRLLTATGWIIRELFEEADRTNIFGALFIGLVFVLLPVAAVANALSGGSPFLALYYLAVLMALAVLNFAGEFGRLSVLNGSAAMFMGVSVFLFVPAYVLRSFTDRILHDHIGHAVLESIAVAPLCYVVAYATMLFYRGFLNVPAPAAAAINGFLAALPAAFVLTFVALQAGAVAVHGSELPKTWPMLMASMVFASAAVPSTLAIIEAANRRRKLVAGIAACICVAAALSAAVLVFGNTSGPMTAARVFNGLLGISADGGRMFLGPDFWVMHIPFLPVIVFVAGLVAVWLAKAVLAVSRRIVRAGIETRRPLALTGFLCLAWAAIMGGLGVSIG